MRPALLRKLVRAAIPKVRYTYTCRLQTANEHRTAILDGYCHPVSGFSEFDVQVVEELPASDDTDIYLLSWHAGMVRGNPIRGLVRCRVVLRNGVSVRVRSIATITAGLTLLSQFAPCAADS